MALVMFIACQEEVIKADVISGRWSIVKASRNGKVTKTLEDAFFDFTSDTTFLTNIFNSDEVYKYVLTPEGFVQQGLSQQAYTVLYGKRDTIEIRTTIRKYDFEFLAVRDTVNSAPVEL